MSPANLAAASRDPHQAVRRVERQQRLVELLLQRGRLTLAELAAEFGVAERTVARDAERLRLSGVPIDSVPGPGGGFELRASGHLEPIAFDVAEVAALIASLAAVGPTVSDSAGSAMRKLVTALGGADPIETGPDGFGPVNSARPDVNPRDR